MIIVKNRQLLFSKNEQYIGTSYDKDSTNREFRLDRLNEDGFDMANLIFKIDLKYTDTDTIDTDSLEATAEDRHILLTWLIPETVTSHTGAIWIQLRAYDDAGLLKWSTYMNVVYIESYIGQATVPSDKISELEKFEAAESSRATAEALRVTAETGRVDAEALRASAEEGRVSAENLRVEAESSRAAAEALRVSAEDERKTQEALRVTAETAREKSFNEKSLLSKSYAVGGTGVRDGEDTDNSKYYSEQSGSHADDSAASATEAAKSSETAETLKYDAEAWAKGTRNGVPVVSGDETYHNNAKYYSDNAKETTGGIYMTEDTYDTHKKGTDIFDYADEAVSTQATAQAAIDEAQNTNISNAQSTAASAKALAEAALPKSGGTMTGSIAMGDNAITGVPDPTAGTDAANKKYVDDKVTAEATRAAGAESTLTTNLAAEVTRAKAAEEANAKTASAAQTAADAAKTAADAAQSAIDSMWEVVSTW